MLVKSHIWGKNASISTKEVSSPGSGFSRGSQRPHPTGPSTKGDDDNNDKAFHPSGNNGTKNCRTDELNKTGKMKMNKSSKIFQALSLPILCNMNPRSVYNKIDEFHAFVEEESIDLLFMSESWERDYLTLNEIIKLEDHVVISNVSQRSGKGGRPALIANSKTLSFKFHGVWRQSGAFSHLKILEMIAKYKR